MSNHSKHYMFYENEIIKRYYSDKYNLNITSYEILPDRAYYVLHYNKGMQLLFIKHVNT